jgi:hypothetical protein
MHLSSNGSAKVPAGLGAFGRRERRRLRVVVLLSELDSVYEASRRETELSGFAPPEHRTYTCGWCAGLGCGRCQRGRIRVAERDPYDTGKLAASAPPEVRNLDRALKLLHSQYAEDELRRLGLLAVVPFESNLRASEHRDERLPFAELRYLLGAMPALEGLEGIDWIGERMRQPIRVPGWAFQRELELLRDEVRKLERTHTEREISRLLAISRRQVRRLGKRHAVA